MKKYWMVYALVMAVLAGAACLVLAVSPSERQQIENFQVSTLKGLKGVAVTVKVVRDEPNTVPLLKEQNLQTEVEVALRNAGIAILPAAPDVGLYVVLAKVSAGGGRDKLFCGIHVQSSLLQIVHLARDTTIRTEAQTWPSFGQSRFGVVSIAVAKSAVEQTIKDQVRDFVGDFKAANPKP
jgi:hypothetical protein